MLTSVSTRPNGFLSQVDPPALLDQMRKSYAGRPRPCPSSHSTQYVPTPLKQRTRAGFPHLQIMAGNILPALAAGTSWFLALKTGWPQTLQGDG